MGMRLEAFILYKQSYIHREPKEIFDTYLVQGWLGQQPELVAVAAAVVVGS